MARQRNTRPSYAVPQGLTPLFPLLSEKSRSNLNSLARAFSFVDTAVLRLLKEHSHVNDDESLNLDQIKIVLSNAPEGLVDGTADETSIVSCLCDTSCLIAWNSGRDVLEHSRESSIYNKPSTLAKRQARKLLDFGVEAMQSLELLREDLFRFERLHASIEARLTSLSRFQEIATTPSDGEYREQTHAFGAELDVWRLHSTTRSKTSATTAKIENRNSGMIAITFLAGVGCIVPLGLAWKHSPADAGSLQDSDFWLLLQTSCFQVLGLGLAFAPMFRKASDHALLWSKVLIYALAALGTSCSVAAPIVYIKVPVIWAFLLSFFSAAFQICLTLELALFADAVWSQDQKLD